MGTKSRESIYGSSIRHSAERAGKARKDADRLACVAWNQRMVSKDQHSHRCHWEMLSMPDISILRSAASAVTRIKRLP